MVTVTGGESRNVNIKQKIALNYTWNCRPLVNLNAKRNDTSVDVNFSPKIAMAALRYGGPSLWRPFAMAALRYSGPLPSYLAIKFYIYLRCETRRSLMTAQSSAVFLYEWWHGSEFECLRFFSMNSTRHLNTTLQNSKLFIKWCLTMTIVTPQMTDRQYKTFTKHYIKTVCL